MDKLKELVLDGNAPESVERVKKLLEEGKEPEVILWNALIPSMDEAGELFKTGEFFIPELLVAARAMKEAMQVLKPHLVKKGIKSEGRIVLGTVKGDMHDIGKNLVAMTFEGAGFEVIDLGVDVTPEGFVEAIKKHKPVAIGMSSLLTATMLEMKNVVVAIEEAGLRKDVKILVGGAPVTQDYADEIGADFSSPDPITAKNYIQSFEDRF
ncbi:MAG: corrinoid protein [Candidatus Hodarchaeota archaeon]